MAKFNVDGIKSESRVELPEQSNITLLPYESLIPSEDNNLSITEIDDLALSISRSGLLQPLTVVPKENGSYQILSGHRRYTAIGKLLQEGSQQFRNGIPCNVRRVEDISLPLSMESKRKLIMLDANLHRENTPEDIANSIKEYEKIYAELKENGYLAAGRERDFIAKYTNMSPAQVSRHQNINKNLDDELKQSFFDNKIPLTVADEIARRSSEEQAEIREAVKNNTLTLSKEGLQKFDEQKQETAPESSALSPEEVGQKMYQYKNKLANLAMQRKVLGQKENRKLQSVFKSLEKNLTDLEVLFEEGNKDV